MACGRGAPGGFSGGQTGPIAGSGPGDREEAGASCAPCRCGHLLSLPGWGHYLCPVSLLASRCVRVSDTQAGCSPCLLAAIPAPGRNSWSQWAGADAIVARDSSRLGVRCVK